MKYFLIFFIGLCPILKASVSMKLTTDYYPPIGRVTLSFHGTDKVTIEWDRNNCFYDNFGSVAGCTLMAPIVSEETLNLVDQNEEFKRYSISNFDKFALILSHRDAKILVFGKDPGSIESILPLHPYFGL